MRSERYVLKDEVFGTWNKYIKASHPMHVDSYMTLDLRKSSEDGSLWAFDFYWTSRIPGGNDESISGIADMNLVSPVYDENNCLEYIVIAKGDSGKIAITNEGIVFLPVLSTSQYILYKFEDAS